MAPLPAERLQIAPPFTNIGLDFTGPLYLKVEGSSEPTTSKAYVCIFICEDTRAVHLELLNTMTTEDFLQAFRRMANWRGMARVIHSDNQTTFHKAAKVFKASTQRMQLMKIDPNVVEDKLANQGVRWKFITERASHRGGHWERVCWQLKEPLRKMLGKAFLNYTEMVTVPTNRHRSNRSKKSASFSSGVTNTEKRMEARRLRRSAFTVSRFLEPLMRNEARVFELASQTNVKSL